MNEQGESLVRFERPKRQSYNKNPLAEVTCEVKFPILLKLVQQGPVELQALLQQSYPLLSVLEFTGGLVTGQNGTESQVSPMFRRYSFKSADSNWNVSVSADSFFLSTPKYTRWEEFRERFAQIFELFGATYNPPRLLRVGLRYIDMVDPLQHGLEEDSYRDWLNPALLGLLNDQRIGNKDVLESNNYALLDIKPRGKLGLRWGIGARLAVDAKPTKVFVLDGDFYEDTDVADLKVANVCTILDDFNYQSGGLFQWAFSENLRARLEPTDL